MTFVTFRWLVVVMDSIAGGSDISPEGGRVLTYDIGLELSPKLPLFRLFSYALKVLADTVVQRVSFVGISSNTRTEPDACGCISLITPVFFDFRVVNKSPT